MTTIASQKDLSRLADHAGIGCAACGGANRVIARYCQHCGARMAGDVGATTNGHSLAVSIGVRSDRGLVRTTQEDLVLVERLDQPDGTAAWLGLVADGIGGQRAGAYAGQVAGKSVAMLLRELLAHPLGQPNYASLLRTAVAGANHCLFAQSQAYAELRGMGTTLTAALLVGSHVFIAHVGDSRAYKLAATSAAPERLTTDHSLAERMVAVGMLEAADRRAHPQAHVLYRSLGEYAQVEADLTITSLTAGEGILLCSDGLVKHIDDHEIACIVHSAPTPQHACDQLIDLCNQRGGLDNTSVILLRMVTDFTNTGDRS